MTTVFEKEKKQFFFFWTEHFFNLKCMFDKFWTESFLRICSENMVIFENKLRCFQVYFCRVLWKTIENIEKWFGTCNLYMSILHSLKVSQDNCFSELSSQTEFCLWKEQKTIFMRSFQKLIFENCFKKYCQTDLKVFLVGLSFSLHIFFQ